MAICCIFSTNIIKNNLYFLSKLFNFFFSRFISSSISLKSLVTYFLHKIFSWFKHQIHWLFPKFNLAKSYFFQIFYHLYAFIFIQFKISFSTKKAFFIIGTFSICKHHINNCEHNTLIWVTPNSKSSPWPFSENPKSFFHLI